MKRRDVIKAAAVAAAVPILPPRQEALDRSELERRATKAMHSVIAGTVPEGFYSSWSNSSSQPLAMVLHVTNNRLVITANWCVDLRELAGLSDREIERLMLRRHCGMLSDLTTVILMDVKRIAHVSAVA